MFSRLGRGVLIAAVCVASQNLGASPMANDADCSHLVVNHTYANAFNGFLNVPAYFASLGVPVPPGIGLVPNGGAGMMTFLPGGKVVNTETLVIGLLGVSKDLLITGTYSLTWDTSKRPVVCSGSLTASSGTGAAYHFDLVVSEGGQRVNMVHTDTGLTVAIAMFPMDTRGCRNETIAGLYSFETPGWFLAPQGAFPPEQLLAGYGPTGFSGAVRYRPFVGPSGFSDAPAGAGSFEEFVTISENGQIVKRASTGWYKVNRDCTGVMTMRDSGGGPDLHVELFVGHNGRAVFMTPTDTVTVNGMTLPVVLAGIVETRMEE